MELTPVRAPRPARSFGRSFVRTLEMIKFSHSVFALPFALLALVLAVGGWPPLGLLGWAIAVGTIPAVHGMSEGGPRG